MRTGTVEHITPCLNLEGEKHESKLFNNNCGRNAMVGVGAILKYRAIQQQSKSEQVLVGAPTTHCHCFTHARIEVGKVLLFCTARICVPIGTHYGGLALDQGMHGQQTHEIRARFSSCQCQ